MALDPTLDIVAPWKDPNFKLTSREAAIDYATQHKIPIEQSKRKIYSRDRNLWHISHEGADLEDPANEPKDDLFVMSRPVSKAPNKAEYVTVGFHEGVPVKLNGHLTNGVKMIEALNQIGGTHAVGQVDLVENRLVGMKSRGVYETPGGTILYAAHRELESLCLDRDTSHYKEQIGVRYAELVYFGKWYHSLREALQSFVETTQESVTGWVKLKLYKGNVIVVGRSSSNSLYREDFATFGQEDVYDQQDAIGFITLFGLQMKVKAMMEVSDGGRTRYAAPDYSKFKRD
jgi:argininosuccinate synthase